MQVLGAPPVTLMGAHCIKESDTLGEVTAKDAVRAAPPLLPVITTDCVDTTVKVAAVKVIDNAAAGMVRDEGIVAAVLLLERLTTAPPDGAAADNVAVQVLDTPPITLAGAHWMEERLTAQEVAKVKVAVCDRPLSIC